MRTLSRVGILVLAGAALFAACGGDGYGSSGSSTSTPTVASTSTESAATATPSALDSTIRDHDLAADDKVQALIAADGGLANLSDAWYADLTGDGVEEAVVPISSEGTAGDIAVIVLTPDGDGTKSIFDYTARGGGGLVASVTDGQLVTTEAAPGPDDQECCPSQLRTVVYAWDGDHFVIASDTTSPNPQAGSKTPVSP